MYRRITDVHSSRFETFKRVCTKPVSYTHLDVYKRQSKDFALHNRGDNVIIFCKKISKEEAVC